jgi:hypothetical protein
LQFQQRSSKGIFYHHSRTLLIKMEANGSAYL